MTEQATHYDLVLTAGAKAQVLAAAKSVVGERFLSAYGSVTDANASSFIHDAKQAGLRIEHSLGSIPPGKSISAWRQEWDHIADLSPEHDD